MTGFRLDPPGARLPVGVEIGDGCLLERVGSFELFRSEHRPGLRLGDRVQVLTWTTFNVEPKGVVEVGDDSVLVGAVFMCAERIQIGRGVVISYGVTIADSDFHPRDPLLRRVDAQATAPEGDLSLRPPLVTAPVEIGDYASVGVGAIILKGVRIGAGAMIGAGAVVTSDVPAGAVVSGNPGRIEMPGA